MVFPFWPGLPVGIEDLLVKSQLRRAQWYVIEFELFGMLFFPKSCEGVQDPSHDIVLIIER